MLLRGCVAVRNTLSLIFRSALSAPVASHQPPTPDRESAGSTRPARCASGAPPLSRSFLPGMSSPPRTRRFPPISLRAAQNRTLPDFRDGLPPLIPRAAQLLGLAARPLHHPERQTLQRNQPRSLTSVIAGITSNLYRRLSESAYEGPTHPVTVTKTYFPRYDVDRVPAVFYHQPRRLNAQVLNCFSRRLARRFVKRATELAWTEMRGFGKPLNRQRGM